MRALQFETLCFSSNKLKFTTGIGKDYVDYQKFPIFMLIFDVPIIVVIVPIYNGSIC